MNGAVAIIRLHVAIQNLQSMYIWNGWNAFLFLLIQTSKLRRQTFFLSLPWNLWLPSKLHLPDIGSSKVLLLPCLQHWSNGWCRQQLQEHTDRLRWASLNSRLFTKNCLYLSVLLGHFLMYTRRNRLLAATPGYHVSTGNGLHLSVPTYPWWETTCFGWNLAWSFNRGTIVDDMSSSVWCVRFWTVVT